MLAPFTRLKKRESKKITETVPGVETSHGDVNKAWPPQRSRREDLSVTKGDHMAWVSGRGDRARRSPKTLSNGG